jgi:hypothetical protein
MKVIACEPRLLHDEAPPYGGITDDDLTTELLHVQTSLQRRIQSNVSRPTAGMICSCWSSTNACGHSAY